MATAESPQADPPKKKKSLFKRTVPRKKPAEPNSESPELAGAEKPQDEPNDLDFFKRSKDVFPMVLQEVLEERPPSPERHDRKRRKVSIEPKSATPAKKLTPAMSGSSGERRKSSSIRKEPDPDSDCIMDVKGKGKEIVKANKLPTARMLFSRRSKEAIASLGEYVDGGDDDDDGDDDDGYDDDDDDDELAVSPVRRSQTDMTPGRRTRQSTRQSNRDSSPVEVIDVDIKPELIDGYLSDLEEIPPPDNDDQLDDEFSVWVAKAQELEASRNPEAIITVCVSCRREGTVPLYVKRKLSQDFQLVLDTWVRLQQRQANFTISDEQASKIVLTWKENKIYKESTPASLGVQVTEDGELKGGGEGYVRGHLHIEAWAEEEYAKYLKKKERKRLKELGLLESDGDASEAEFGAQNDSPPAKKKKGIKVILKTKEFDALNTTVHDDTTVDMLISVFRTQRGVGPERDIEIWLDGERLEDESLVIDADIDPDEPNQLEVHIK